MMARIGWRTHDLFAACYGDVVRVLKGLSDAGGESTATPEGMSTSELTTMLRAAGA